MVIALQFVRRRALPFTVGWEMSSACLCDPEHVRASTLVGWGDAVEVPEPHLFNTDCVRYVPAPYATPKRRSARCGHALTALGIAA